MKKFVALLSVAVVAGFGLFAGTASACGHSKVIYRTSSQVVRHTPVVYSSPSVTYTSTIVRPTPVVRTTTVVTKPAVVARTVIGEQPVVQITRRLLQIAQGSVIRAKVRFAGMETGEVTIRSGQLELKCEVVEWSPNLVVFRLPRVEVLEDSEVKIQIFKATGVIARSVDGLLTAGDDFTIEAPVTTITQATSEVLR